ncbi:M20 metallopeptidase family protein [Gudongella sp. SC589]|jgi:amidohydrolase|uniref:M20 metallopeptidase family protein n=1 Tax=Gudongella sp. SC589 TaxID=3385990 RepID=UPI0039048F54
MEIRNEIERLREELIGLRRDFHENPELGFQEFRTGKVVADYLEGLGLEVRRNVAKTGVVGLLRGKGPGRTIALRTDMDALPLSEATGLGFSSRNEGVMHACGHDGHLAMMLVAAKVLSGIKDELRGNVKFIFQPNEEDAGAEIMIGEGILENPTVDAAVGMHLWSPIQSGKIGIAKGPLMASSYYFKIIVHGRGGHGGAPHTTISPILSGIDMIKALQEMVLNETDPLKPTIISFGKVSAGTYPIIIPEKMEIEGSLRCLHKDTLQVQDRIREVVDGISRVHRTTFRLEFKCGNDLLYNNEEMTSLAEEIAEGIVGRENLITSDISVMLGEDFAEFSKRVPSTFIFLGTANQKKGTDYPHHHPKFNIDEDVLPIGVELLVKTAMEYLEEKSA